MGCGELCVHLLCEYYEIEYPQQKVLQILTPGASGETSLQQMQECLEMLGFQCSAMRGGYEALTQLDVPVILFLEPGYAAVGHFGVVMKSQQNGRLLAYDPYASFKPIEVERKTLQKHWKGVALLSRRAGPGHNIRAYAIISICAALVGMCFAYLRDRNRRTGLEATIAHAIRVCRNEGFLARFRGTAHKQAVCSHRQRD
jgi:ABC-type bacteriocin/lantibiotic exporter with double-glycine peptidase domain